MTGLQVLQQARAALRDAGPGPHVLLVPEHIDMMQMVIGGFSLRRKLMGMRGVGEIQLTHTVSEVTVGRVSDAADAVGEAEGATTADDGTGSPADEGDHAEDA